MDYDRKSTVSSFYGRPSDARGRRESQSSFYNNAAVPPGAQRPGAGEYGPGYRSSGYGSGLEYGAGAGYAEGGQEAEDGWDVYADFNNAGPKYSTAFTRRNDASYQPLTDPPPHTPRSAKLEDDAESAGAPVELVTVPALGPEWKASELRDMTKRGKREKRAEARGKFWKEFSRDGRGLFGRKWLSRRFIVFFCFFFCVAIGILLAFTIPRVPGFLFNSDSPLQAATGSWNGSIPIEFSRLPTNFSFPAIVDLQVDTGSNYLPLTFNQLNGFVYDLNTLRQVGTGHINKTTLPAKTRTTLMMPLNFTYSALNSSDQTWSNWHSACENKGVVVGGVRPGINFRLIIEMSIAGLPGTHTTSTSVNNAPCPIELPESSS